MRSLAVGVLCLVPLPGMAEIVSASATEYVLRHEAESSLDADVLWNRLVRPSAWWHPDHTYSGDAANLVLELETGGLWREDWDGGSVAHGRVLFVQDGKILRLEAPFGPLQGVGAYTIWTITVEATDDGSRVVFEETSIGPSSARLAEAVDFVKSEAIARLIGD